MIYTIKGGKKSERQLVIEALWFAKQYLLPRHKVLEIDIELTKNLDVDGDVIEGDDEREFWMRLRKGMDRDDLLTSVFHEMVHVKQSVKKEYPLFDCTKIPYMKRPWEKEAYELQEVMLKEWNKEKAA